LIRKKEGKYQQWFIKTTGLDTLDIVFAINNTKWRLHHDLVSLTAVNVRAELYVCAVNSIYVVSI
jgi:hypothetical protein